MAMIPISGTYEVVGGAVTFTPTSDLPEGTVIRVTLNTDIRGEDNERLASPEEFSFTTASGE